MITNIFPSTFKMVGDQPQADSNDYEKDYFESKPSKPDKNTIYNITKHPLGGYITNFDDESLKKIDSFTQKVKLKTSWL